MEIQSSYLINVSEVLYHFASHPDRLDDFANSFSATQYTSKQWLVNKVKQLPLPTGPSIFIMGGWYGTYLVPMLLNHVKPSKIIFNDIDPFCVGVAKMLHKDTEDCEFVFNNENMNISTNIQYKPLDLIINTSCEHMNPMRDITNINPQCVYALQSASSKEDPGHINTCNTSMELREQSGIKELLFRGSLSIREGKTRFMVIGRK